MSLYTTISLVFIENQLRFMTLILLKKMGNYNCCSSQRQSKHTVRIKSIKTTYSLDCPEDFLDKKNLIPEFIDNYSNALPHLQKNKGCFLFNPSCFNVTLESKIGKGAHSEVYLVKTDYQTNFMQMALKIIPKQKLKSDALKKSLAMQNLLLTHNTCPFLFKSYMNRQDENYIYYFGPIAPGGDLISFTQQSSARGCQFAKKQEQNVRFILAGVILGLEYLHKIGIVLNDLKLENILVDKQGYPVLTDFGLVEPENTEYFQDVVGTINYFSPEKMVNTRCSRAVDFWALGVVIYALVYHEYPFDKELIESERFLQEARNKQYKHKKLSPKGSPQLKDLINQLLIQQPDNRLGMQNIDDLKQHKFFKTLNWTQYEARALKSPLARIIEKHPLKFQAEEITMSKVKIFRQSVVEEEFLWPIEATLKLKRSLCSTVDRASIEGSSEFINLSPLHKTRTSISPQKKEPGRKKSVSFDLGHA